jgi:hypothetical protein
MDKYIKELFPRLRDVMLQTLFPFPIYVKGEDGVTPVLDENGQPIVDWKATYIARTLSIITAAYGTYAVFGLRVSEIVAYIEKLLGY